MQMLEQRISQLMVSIISCIFVGRFAYYYAKAPELMSHSSLGFSQKQINVTVWNRVQFAWNKANTGN